MGQLSIWATSDGGLWSKAGANKKTPGSTYSHQFMDPRDVYKAQRELREQINDKNFVLIDTKLPSDELDEAAAVEIQ